MIIQYSKGFIILLCFQKGHMKVTLKRKSTYKIFVSA